MSDANKFVKGDFAQLNGKPCVIVGVDGDKDVPSEHLAAWFGGDGPLEVWTVPAEYFEPAEIPPVVRH